MTWTSAVGRTSKVILHGIVHGLALTRISPNVLTFLGLVINAGAAVLFGYANADNQASMFRWAAAVIVGAGIFDLSSQDLKILAQRLSRGRRSAERSGEPSPLLRQADHALLTVEQAVLDFNQAAAEISQIDENEDREAA